MEIRSNGVVIATDELIDEEKVEDRTQAMNNAGKILAWCYEDIIRFAIYLVGGEIALPPDCRKILSVDAGLVLMYAILSGSKEVFFCSECGCPVGSDYFPVSEELGGGCPVCGCCDYVDKIVLWEG